MEKPLLLDPKAFESTLEGKSTALYTLKNAAGLTAQITNYGARVVSLWVPDKQGQWADVVLGYESLDPYRKTNYYGATIGRYGNRIAGSQFTIAGQTYKLPANEGENQLHGGEVGFQAVVWEVSEQGEDFLTLRHVSPDGHMGYPGTLTTELTYRLTEQQDLLVTYRATTDKATHVNLTHHSYFHLAGAGQGTAHQHQLTILADQYLPVSPKQIPTGELASVAGTPFDLREPIAVGAGLSQAHEQLRIGGGYDHTWVLQGTAGEERLAAAVYEPTSGRTMEIYTTEPGLQFYSGNGMHDTEGKYGQTYVNQGAICLETQHFPNSPNQPDFPSTLLEPGQVYTSLCRHRFGVR